MAVIKPKKDITRFFSRSLKRRLGITVRPSGPTSKRERLAERERLITSAPATTQEIFQISGTKSPVYISSGVAKKLQAEQQRGQTFKEKDIFTQFADFEGEVSRRLKKNVPFIFSKERGVLNPQREVELRRIYSGIESKGTKVLKRKKLDFLIPFLQYQTRSAKIRSAFDEGTKDYITNKPVQASADVLLGLATGGATTVVSKSQVIKALATKAPRIAKAIRVGVPAIITLSYAGGTAIDVMSKKTPEAKAKRLGRVPIEVGLFALGFKGGQKVTNFVLSTPTGKKGVLFRGAKKTKKGLDVSKAKKLIKKTKAKLGDLWIDPKKPPPKAPKGTHWKAKLGEFPVKVKSGRTVMLQKVVYPYWTLSKGKTKLIKIKIPKARLKALAKFKKVKLPKIKKAKLIRVPRIKLDRFLKPVQVPKITKEKQKQIKTTRLKLKKVTLIIQKQAQKVKQIQKLKTRTKTKQKQKQRTKQILKLKQQLKTKTKTKTKLKTKLLTLTLGRKRPKRIKKPSGFVVPIFIPKVTLPKLKKQLEKGKRVKVSRRILGYAPSLRGIYLYHRGVRISLAEARKRFKKGFTGIEMRLVAVKVKRKIRKRKIRIVRRRKRKVSRKQLMILARGRRKLAMMRGRRRR